jgi:hypothetical protein
MQHVQDILIELFQGVLMGGGPSPPKLVDIVLERRCGRLMAKFSDGRCVSVDVQSVNLYRFWQEHAVWDFGSLQQALLREGRTLYAALTDYHGNEWRLWNEGGSRETQRSSAHDDLRSIRARLQMWWTSQWAQPMGASSEHLRGADLLMQNLSPDQRRQYTTCGYFDVIGGNSGNQYRIRRGYQMNVEELDAAGRRIRLLCFMPRGRLVTGDVMLAQKLALELFEGEVLRIANAVPAEFGRLGSSAAALESCSDGAEEPSHHRYRADH